MNYLILGVINEITINLIKKIAENNKVIIIEKLVKIETNSLKKIKNPNLKYYKNNLDKVFIENKTKNMICILYFDSDSYMEKECFLEKIIKVSTDYEIENIIINLFFNYYNYEENLIKGDKIVDILKKINYKNISIMKYYLPIFYNENKILKNKLLNNISRIIYGENFSLIVFKSINNKLKLNFFDIDKIAKFTENISKKALSGINFYNINSNINVEILEFINKFKLINNIKIPYILINGKIVNNGKKVKKFINVEIKTKLNIDDIIEKFWELELNKIIYIMKEKNRLTNHMINSYKEWLKLSDFETKMILINNRNNLKFIENNFYKDLEFGTGGVREKIGIGPNRINLYTIIKITQGLIEYIKKLNINEPKVIICYDTRNKSKFFAERVCHILSINNIKALIFKESRPTPELSYAIRFLSCNFGIVITASHNPPEYNGYKIYQKDGVQIVPKIAKKIANEVNNISIFKTTNKKNNNLNKIEKVLEEIDSNYIKYIENNLFNKKLLSKTNLKILYTPIHGTGAKPISQLCRNLKIKNYFEVKEQMNQDINFSTVEIPNPEVKSSFYMAIEKAKKINSDIILGTDPDCDRVGVLVKNTKDYRLLNGNEIGALLLVYILENLTNIPKNGNIIKTIVTSDLGNDIAKDYNISVIDTLTGFKYIGEKICELELTNKTFIFGYEESFGYLYGNQVKDKDAVMATLLIIEMAAYYNEKGLTLIDKLNKIYKKYGYRKEELVSLKYEGKSGAEKIFKILDYFRKNKINLKEFIILEKIDYINGVDGLSKSNVLKFFIKDIGSFVIRPSGTEPKIKIYFLLKGKDDNSISKKYKILKENILEIIDNIT